jgi:sarcosine oxidase gamma subunit
VLNGTTTPGLARGVANRLSNAKFKTGNVTNAADQSHSATIVQYAPAHKKEALEVAKAIDVKADAVQPIDQGSQSLAGTEAIVVVTVGADQLASPQQQTP